MPIHTPVMMTLYMFTCYLPRGHVHKSRVEYSVGARSVCPQLFRLFAHLRHVQGIVKYLEGSSCKKQPVGGH